MGKVRACVYDSANECEEVSERREMMLQWLRGCESGARVSRVVVRWCYNGILCGRIYVSGRGHDSGVRQKRGRRRNSKGVCEGQASLSKQEKQGEQGANGSREAHWGLRRDRGSIA